MSTSANKPGLDDREFPLVVMHLPNLSATEDIDALIAQLERVHERGSAVFVTDLGDLADISPRVARHLASRLDDLARRYPKGVLGIAVVVHSRIIKTIYTMYLSLRRHKPYPSACFDNRADALAWANEKLRAAGLVQLLPEQDARVLAMLGG